MYDKLLVAVDRSDAAERVVKAAREIALLSDGEVWLLHVREKEIMPRGGSFEIETEQEALSVVERTAQDLTDAGIKTHYEVRKELYGYAARAIVAAAQDYDAGIIVMGSRGHSDLVGLVLGSTAHKVIHLSDRPVLVVR
jgi:nucleotide-binding universal stress UspA family protein